ncbi:MAG: SLBB domain-containing protein [bacterium]
MFKKLFVLFIFLSVPVFSQVDDYRLGTQLGRYQTQGGLYDYSEAETVNIKVAIWGFVKFPGRYIVPIYTNVRDLISFAGGPTDDALLDDLRIYRMLEDSTQSLIRFNYNDLMWENELKTKNRYVPDLRAGDILLVPGSERYYFRDTMQMILSVLSTAISLAILIWTITRN